MIRLMLMPIAVSPELYACMGEALIYGLETRLGDSFGEDSAQAWSKAYAFISATMITFSNQSKESSSCTVM